MLYMIEEQFRGGRPEAVYARFRECGRMAPEELHYVASWVTTDGTRCFQVMECEERALLGADVRGSGFAFRTIRSKRHGLSVDVASVSG